MAIPLFMLAAIAAAIAGAVVLGGRITLDRLLGWFRERAARVRIDPDKAAVTIMEAVGANRVRIIQGIFDAPTARFNDARVLESADVADDVRDAHRDRAVVIWQ
jgi:hypothetical protein